MILIIDIYLIFFTLSSKQVEVLRILFIIFVNICFVFN